MSFHLLPSLNLDLYTNSQHGQLQMDNHKAQFAEI